MAQRDYFPNHVQIVANHTSHTSWNFAREIMLTTGLEYDVMPFL